MDPHRFSLVAMSAEVSGHRLAYRRGNADQAGYLLRHGCDEVQGYLYGRPVPAAEIRK
jgi:EAL domain-containing protein (putative c-di-GMP-specific phosphodiesterase class I)